MIAILALSLFAIPLHAQSWRSTLYPENWQRPAETSSFYNDKLIQDFSYAGYKSGEQDIPNVAGPIFDVTTYGADNSGSFDSTVAIQNAINAAQTAGGGVVYLPAGLYHVSPQGTNSWALRISASNIVLRGAGAQLTRLVNTSDDMRNKRVILIQPSSSGAGAAINLTADLDGPTRRLPVSSPSSFAPGDIVRLQWTFTDSWITEHSQQAWWSASNGPADARYLCEVVATNVAEGWIEIKAPTRYSMKTRDNSRVTKLTGYMSGVGVESLAIGNVQLTGTTWGEEEYSDPTKASYQAHASYLLQMRDSVDSWVTGVESFKPAGNTSTCHMLSNGILLINCMRVSVIDCKMSRSQYGGGGGNGYMYRLQNSNECLLKNCLADFSRHGIVVSHAGTSGNVFLQCEDRETRSSTGHTRYYQTGGSGSDHHMHFSHSNLFDRCHAHNSFYTASHRGNSGTTPHGLSSAHGIYWNTTGSGTRYNDIVLSNQGRYGYVIGTSGSKFGATNPTTNNTAPADHLEGIGTGATLEPASLYLDQLERRIVPRLTLTSGTIRFPTNTFVVDATITLDGQPLDAELLTLDWIVTDSPAGAKVVAKNVTSGRKFTVSHPGSYSIEASGNYEGQSFEGTLTINVLPISYSGQTIDLFTVADSNVQGGTSAANNYGSSTSLALKNDGGANVEREAFMRFDLSGINTANISSSTLHLFFTSTATDAVGRASIINDSGNWGELSINWNNRPTIQKALIGDWTPALSDWRLLDTTGVLQANLEANDTITFRHQIVSQLSNFIYSIASKENSTITRRPFLRLQMAPQTLAAWLTDTANLEAPDLDPNGDPDKDGITNIQEAWLGTDASEPEFDALPEALLTDDEMEFDVEVNTAPPAGLFYYIEYSDTLGNDWQPVPDVVWESIGTAVDGRQPMIASLPHDPALEQRFYRFVVQIPE